MKSQGSTKPTIKEVAALAGVSIGTASQILHGKSSLHLPHTGDKVRAAVRELGYKPNVVARSLVRRRSRTFGIVAERYLGMLTRNPYFSYILNGVVDCAVGHRYQCSIIVLQNDAVEHAAENIENGAVDGVILAAPAIDSPLLEWARQSGFPAVAVGIQGPAEVGISTVDVDSFTSLRDAIRWMIGLGHRKIGFIKGPEFAESAAIRLEAYLSAMQDAGLPPCPEWIAPGDYQRRSGFEAACRLIRSDPAITAIVAANDPMALGAMDALRGIGLHVPNDISVLGFDDIEAASVSNTPLTTVRQPVEDIGRRAAELLIAHLEREERSVQRVLFPGALIKRDSVGPVRR